MSLITPNQSLFSSSLKGLVIVLTGGAQGVGRSVVEQLHAAGAKVIFGDVNDTPATKLVSTLNSKATDSEERVHFVHCDTSNYANQLVLFQRAYNLYKRIDIVIANAAIVIHKDPFTVAHESDEAILSAPSLAEIDVNLKGLLYTTRLGLHYLRKNPTTTSPSGYKGDVVLVSSIAGFKESGGHTTYTASKHGVIGVMRGLALEETRMVTGIEQGWADRGLPSNEAADVANAILICATANRSIGLESEQKHEGAVLPFNGKIVYVAGGKSYEIEDRIQALEPEWLGRENSEILEKGQEFLHSGMTSWETSK
ncbi:15-hydroxyprostaglandin dehydrogenase [Talaromyces pinophilus]|uniref:15-hydroxyprostaglandin dehydrogenase n=1 Tax=Talaromyces pinophilus TaxID=128442 RepID=A0A6V8HDG2_TALPI|nr:15-hydroxyprostaglandin dehydrogenase [Talaromyces pinophilus]